MRQELAGAFFFLLPGPKMIWEFGELGYDYSINRCEDGSISENCRLSPKPIRWDFQFTKERKALYNRWSALIKLKKENNIFNTNNFTYRLSPYQKSIHLNSDNINVVIIGNFAVKNATINPQFQHKGWWYDYFSGDSIFIDNSSEKLNLSAGEYHIYSDKTLKYSGYNSIIKVDDNDYFNVYPNPAYDILHLTIKSSHHDTIKYSIIDLQGKVILSNKVKTEIGENKYTINLPKLQSGFYIINIAGDNLISNKKLIISK